MSTVKLSAVSCVYNGKVRTPAVQVKDSAGKALVKNTDYKVIYSAGRKRVGKYLVKVTFAGSKYSGSKRIAFEINPKGTTIVKKAAGKNRIAIRWSAQKVETSGYQIQCSTDSRFRKSNRTATLRNNATTYYKISKCNTGRVYYVRVRTYKNVKVSGKVVKIYSAWSKVVAIKAK